MCDNPVCVCMRVYTCVCVRADGRGGVIACQAEYNRLSVEKEANYAGSHTLQSCVFVEKGNPDSALTQGRGPGGSTHARTHIP